MDVTKISFATVVNTWRHFKCFLFYFLSVFYFFFFTMANANWKNISYTLFRLHECAQAQLTDTRFVEFCYIYRFMCVFCFAFLSYCVCISLSLSTLFFVCMYSWRLALLPSHTVSIVKVGYSFFSSLFFICKALEMYDNTRANQIHQKTCLICFFFSPEVYNHSLNRFLLPLCLCVVEMFSLYCYIQNCFH